MYLHSRERLDDGCNILNPTDLSSYSIRDYLYTNNVQLGATYKAGTQSTEAYNAGVKAAADYVNASPDEIGM